MEIKPCPNCGRLGRWIIDLDQRLRLHCDTCRLDAPPEIWNRLSSGMALIEDITVHLDSPDWTHESESDDNGSWIATCEGRSILRTLLEDWRNSNG